MEEEEQKPGDEKGKEGAATNCLRKKLFLKARRDLLFFDERMGDIGNKKEGGPSSLERWPWDGILSSTYRFTYL